MCSEVTYHRLRRMFVKHTGSVSTSSWLQRRRMWASLITIYGHSKNSSSGNSSFGSFWRLQTGEPSTFTRVQRLQYKYTFYTQIFTQFTTDRITTFPNQSINRFMEKLINSNSKTSSNDIINDISTSYITVQQSQFTALSTFTVNNLTTFYWLYSHTFTEGIFSMQDFDS